MTPFRYLPHFCAVILTLAVWSAWTWHYGVVWTPDSFTYCAVARSLLAGEGLYTGLHYRSLVEVDSIMTYWPPGFPVLWALVAGVLNRDPDQVVQLLCAGQLVVAVVLLVELIGRLNAGPRRYWLGLMVALFSPLIWVCTRVWSEPLYLIVWLLQTLWLHRLIMGGGDPARVWNRRLGFFANGMLLGGFLWVRHAALPLLVLVPCLAVWGLAARSDTPRREKIRSVGSLVFGAMVVSGVWAGISVSQSGHFGYAYAPNVAETGALWDQLIRVIRGSFSHGLLPPHANDIAWFPWLVRGVTVVVLGAAWWGRRRWFHRNQSPPGARWLTGLLCLEAMTSLAFYWVARVEFHMDDPDPRLLLPTCMPLFVVVVGRLGGLLQSGGKIAAAGLAAFWACVVAAVAVQLPQMKTYGFFEQDRFSAMADWVGNYVDDHDLVVTLGGEWVHYRTGKPVLLLHAKPWALPWTEDSLVEWVDVWSRQKGGQVFLITHGPMKKEELFGPLVATLSEGRAPPILGVVATELHLAPRFRVWTLAVSPILEDAEAIP